MTDDGMRKDVYNPSQAKYSPIFSPKYFLEKEVPTKAVRTLAYYDVVNFARKIKCPVFYSFGFNDQTCCPTSTYAAYNVIMSPKKLVRTFTNGHWRFSVTNEEAKKWCDSQCTD